jgi:hypothetical protein
MSIMSDAKKLLADCQRSEDEICDIISFHTSPCDIVSVQYHVEQVPKKVEECRDMIFALSANYNSTAMFKLRDNLRRMAIRLEAEILYAKDYFKLD